MLSLIRSTRRTAPTVLGLDLGQAAIRAVQLRRAPDSPSSAGGAGDTQPFAGPWMVIDAVQWDRRPDEPAELKTGWSERLRRGLRQRAFRGRRVAVGFSSPDVEIHALELPDDAAAGQAPVVAAARIEIERLMSFEDGSAETDFWRIPRGRGTRTDALGVAAPRARVLEIWDLCRRAGLDCRRIDASACAVARLGTMLRFAGPRDIWGALDLGYRAARLALCVDDVPVLARAFDTGGAKWTARIAEGLQVSPASAELHKRDHGLALAGRGLRRRNRAAAADDEVHAVPAATAHVPNDELAGMITSILRSELDQLAAEIERSYAYVQQCFPERGIGGLMLVGGGALTRNLEHHLSQRLGISVRAADGWSAGERSALRWSGTQRQPISTLGVAIGLALSEYPA
jgi:Tfp pilus assembly PilM family ATPase